MKKFGIICLLAVLAVAPVYAAWPLIAWKMFESTAMGVAGNAVYDWIKENGTREKIAEKARQINEMLEKAKEYRKAAQNPAAPPEVKPAAAELKRVEESLTAAKELTELAGRTGSLEQRVTAIEQHIAKLTGNLEAYNATPQGQAKPVNIPDVAPGLKFNINYVYRPGGRGNMIPLENGAILHSGDHYKLVFAPQQDAYVYVFQTDSSDAVYRLFPMQEMKGVTVNNFNPVKAGKTYSIPAENKSFFLDQQTGMERIYFIAAAQPDKRLEQAYQQLEEQRGRNAPEDKLQLAENKVMQEVLERPRGLGGIIADPQATAKQQVKDDDGNVSLVSKQRLAGRCDAPGGCIHVLTFEHR